MITGQHSTIRSAELDDLHSLRALYAPDPPRSLHLDRRRELYIPTSDELRETINRPEVRLGFGLLAIEDREGNVRGFCALRGISQEAGYAEAYLAFIDLDDLATPMAEEVFQYLRRRAFVELRLNKLVAFSLDLETQWRAFLVHHGFTSDGVQREMVYTMGAYHDVESFTLAKQPEGAE